MAFRESAALALAYARSLLSFWIDGPPRPFSATFAVTNRCNLRCSYCNCPFLDPSELNLEDIARLFARLRAIGVRRLGLAGGEPLLRTDLAEILRLARSHGFWVSVNSNLSLFERRGACLEIADLVYTSLDGSPAAHAAARGDRNALAVVEAARALVRAGVPVIAICVVTEHNLDQMDHLLDVAEESGFQMHFQPQCVDTELVRGSVASSVPHWRWQQFWRRLLEEKRRDRPVASSTAYLEAISRWPNYSVSALYDPGRRCAAGRGYFYIDPQGVAYPCAYTKGKTPGVYLLREDWRSAWDCHTPCTRCVVGPMLEFNLLFEKPLRSVRDHARSTLRASLLRVRNPMPPSPRPALGDPHN